METILRTFVVLCLTSYCWILAAHLPEFFKKCKEEDLACIKESVHNGLRHMKNGIPSLNVPAMDPMRVPKFNVSAGKKLFRAKTYYKNVDIFGQSDGNLEEIVFDLKKGAFKLVLNMPQYRFNGDYVLQGEIVGEKVDASGRCDHRLKHLTIYTTCKLNRFKRGDDEYLKVTDCGITFELQYLRWNFTGLPHKVQEKFSEHGADFFYERRKEFGYDYSLVASAIINAFFENIPTTELFLK